MGVVPNMDKSACPRTQWLSLPALSIHALRRMVSGVRTRLSSSHRNPGVARPRFGVYIALAAALGLCAGTAGAQSVTGNFPIPTASPLAFGIAAGPDGNLWFTESNSNKIGRITTAGVITEFQTLSAGSAPNQITAGPDGNLWFTIEVPNKIGRITTAGVVTEFSVITGNALLNGIAAGADGALWFAEENANKIGRITTSGAVSEVPTPTAGSDPINIAAGSDGNLWFTETNVNKIGRITTAGVITEFPLPTPGQPYGITAGPDGNLWFTTGGSNIGRITTAGVITAFPIPSTGSRGIITGPDGNLWYILSGQAKIGRITTAGVATEFSMSQTGSFFLALGSDGNLWFPTNNNSIARFNITAGAALPPTITNGPPPNGTVGVPYSFAYTSTGSPTFSVTTGNLPPGLSLSAAGVISGLPITVGTFSGTTTASNGTAPNATQNFSITIGAVTTPAGPAAAIPTLGESVTSFLALLVAFLGWHAYRRRHLR